MVYGRTYEVVMCMLEQFKSRMVLALRVSGLEALDSTQKPVPMPDPYYARACAPEVLYSVS
jgi:hypothetical protein